MGGKKLPTTTRLHLDEALSLQRGSRKNFTRLKMGKEM